MTPPTRAIRPNVVHILALAALFLAPIASASEHADREPPTCPANVKAEALGDGSIRLEWDAVAEAEAYVILKAAAGGAFTLAADLDASATAHLDTNTTVGVTYEYVVLAYVGLEQSVGCTVIEVTSVPFLPGGLAAGLTGLVAVAVVVLATRRA